MIKIFFYNNYNEMNYDSICKYYIKFDNILFLDSNFFIL